MGRSAAARGPILFWLAVFVLALGILIPLDRAVGSAAGNLPPALPTATPLGQSRTVDKRAEFVLQVDDLSRTVERINDILLHYGGYTRAWNEWTYEREGQSVRAMWALLYFPSAEFETVLAELRAASAAILDEEISGAELGDQIVDLKASLRALEAEEKRLLVLQQEAETEQARRQADDELTNVQEELAAAEEQLKELEDLVRWSTLIVEMRQYTPLPTATPTITPTPRPTPTEEPWRISATYRDAIALRDDILAWFTSLESVCLFALCCLPTLFFGGIIYNLFFARLRK